MKKINIDRGKKFLILITVIAILISIIGILSIPEFSNFGTTSFINEDISPLFEYNFSSNVVINSSDPDDNIIIFSVLDVNSSLYPQNSSILFFNWFILDTSTGILTINASNDNQTGEFNLSVFVRNEQSLGESRPFYFKINATNDAPEFINIKGRYNLTANQNFISYINASDEENHYPLVFNINFSDSCTHAVWSDRTNCSLLDFINISNTSVLINFTPSKNDVGIYFANISVMDYGENYTCYSGYCDANYQNNQTTYHQSVIVFNVFSTLFINVSDCQNKIFQENQENRCQINISTKGQTDLINISSLAILRNFNGFVSNNFWFYPKNSTNTLNFSATIYINVTPGKTEIGNWTINLTVKDLTYNENLTEQIFIYVNRTNNDPPEIRKIQNINTSIDLLTIINITVYDDDLLIPDKNATSGGYNENISFITKIYNRSDLNQELTIPGFDIEILSMPVIGTNRTEARISFTPNLSDAGKYTINITVKDLENAFNETLFNLTIFSNSAPVWNSSMQTVFFIIEDNSFYMNFSLNVSDPDGDVINFSFNSDTSFPSFNLNLSTGIASFIPKDIDVGQHIVSITASDGFLTGIKSFNFTIYNINDSVVIEKPIKQSDIINASVNGNSNIQVIEDNTTTINIWVQDDDFKIPQKSFYDESLTFNFTINGVNTSLFVFNRNPAFPIPGSNRTNYFTTFTPRKPDVGNYNITINVTDISGNFDILFFNLTVIEAQHYPVIMDLINHTTAINRSFYYKINASDVEDGSTTELGNTNLTFKYSFMNGNDFINNDENIFNITSGQFNITFNSSHGGVYRINVTVNDTSGRENSKTFYIYVYDSPIINSPISSFVYNLVENLTYNLTFNANHTIADNLTYLIYITNKYLNESLKLNISYYGNSTNLSWTFSPNFTDEISLGNLTLMVYPSNKNLTNNADVNSSRTWNITIKNTNYPLKFTGNIGGSDSTIIGNSPQEVVLSDFFIDIDADDPLHYQSITFSVTQHSSIKGAIAIGIIDWINGTTPKVNFIAVSDSVANFSITGYEHNESDFSHILRNITSNVFTVNLTVSTIVIEVPKPTGGGSTPVPVSFKIITPSSISTFKNEKIIIPLELVNSGTKEFRNINITSLGFKEGKTYSKLKTSLDKTFFTSLSPKQTENLTLTIFFDEKDVPLGTYEILINASSQSPKYTDWAKIQINLQEIDITKLKRYLIFAEELIIKNSECTEIRELMKISLNYFDNEEYSNSRLKAEEAVAACEKNIFKVPATRKEVKSFIKIPFYVIMIIIILSIIIVGFHLIRRLMFMRKIGID